MIALQFLSVFQVTIILCTTSLAYPVFGNKRYNGRSLASPHGNINSYSSWGNSQPQPYQQFVRAQRFPVNYYEMYPYNREYQEYQQDYYPQESISYPVYYPPPRTSKYEVYQAVLPYYYGERPLTRQDYAYYGYDKDPSEDLEEEMIQEVEREEREEAQPIGQEVLYESDDKSDDRDNLDDVNAAFLQNLIMSQMYKDANNKQNYYENSDYYFDDEDKEDNDVKELKQLADAQRQFSENRPTEEDRVNSFSNKQPKKTKAKTHHLNNKYNDKRAQVGTGTGKASEDELKFGSRKMSVSTTPLPKREVRKGQKEEVLMRPATPVRNPFASPILQMMKSEPERKREPSVYDTIKHMLDMEKSLENAQEANELRAPMRKRIISSEDSLTRQLSVLKKSK